MRFASGLAAFALLTTSFGQVLASAPGESTALATRDLEVSDPTSPEIGGDSFDDVPDFDDEWDGAEDGVEPLGEWEDVEAGATQWDLKPRSASHSPAVKRSDAGEGHSLVKRKSKGARITWYTGHDMDDPYCWPQGGFQPRANMLVAAVAINWHGKPKCKSYVQLKRGSHSVIVRVVDMCAGCKPNNVPWFDLSERAFKALGLSLDAGVANGIQYRSVGRPKNHSRSTYGP